MALSRDDIRELQAGLHLLGYEGVGAIDGRAGTNTNAQIAAFLTATGSAAAPDDLDAIYDAVRRAVSADPAAQERLRALADTQADLTREQRRILQGGLNLSGIRDANGDELAVDGVNGRDTRSAVAAFNQTAGATPLPAANAVLTAEQVSLLQGGLIALGYDAGPIDGKPGDLTGGALQNFLAARGLDIPATATGDALLAVQTAIKEGLAQDRMRAIGDNPAATAVEITALQAALTLNGQYAPMDGIAGNITRTALTAALAGYAPVAEAAPEPLEAVPVGEVERAPLPEIVVETRIDEPVVEQPAIVPRTAETVEAEMRAIAAAYPFSSLETDYIAMLRENPNVFHMLHQRMSERAGEGETYRLAAEGMTKLVTLENERLQLLAPAADITAIPVIAPDTAEDPPRTVQTVEEEQRALFGFIADLDPTSPLPDSYLRMAHGDENERRTLANMQVSAAAKAAEGNSFYGRISESLTKLIALEDERRALLDIETTVLRPAVALTGGQTVADIEQDQKSLFTDPVIADLNIDYITMMRENRETFDLERARIAERAGNGSLMYRALDEALTKLVTLEDRRQTALATAEPPALRAEFAATAALPLTYSPNPLGLGPDTTGALLMASMPGYDEMDPHRREIQFATDQLKTIYGTNGQVTMTDAAYALLTYNDKGEIDYSAVDRVAAELGIERNARFDLSNPAELNRVLTGLAALQSGGLDKVENGTHAVIAAVSGFEPAAVPRDDVTRTMRPVALDAGM